MLWDFIRIREEGKAECKGKTHGCAPPGIYFLALLKAEKISFYFYKNHWIQKCTQCLAHGL